MEFLMEKEQFIKRMEGSSRDSLSRGKLTALMDYTFTQMDHTTEGVSKTLKRTAKEL